ncbi:hypothetical protein [Elongatibacter sediminis]|uniref:Bacterial virulence factor lipase N-terminal domain-containing protein n=1 Tax=Elongatibacter sediminis TaxID=3119006 RepID=A0AAW9RNV0_9GAMM
MKKRLSFTLILLLVVLQAQAAPTQPARNKDGSIVTEVLTPVFDASAGLLPFPINLLFTGTTDLTLNIPVADPTDFGDPAVALSAMDGFSTTEAWTVNFVKNPISSLNTFRPTATIDPASVVPGQSVRMFEVSTVFGTIVQVSGVVRELEPGVEYTATLAAPDTIAILPLLPLKELTTYMAVITNDVRDSEGNDATPDQQYFIGKRPDPLIDANGNSTTLLPTANAQALEGLRQIINAQEAAAAAAGVNPDDIVVSWTAQTQSITPVLKNLRSVARPAPTTAAPMGIDTGAVGGAGIADLYMGVITLPYYLGVPSQQNPVAPLTEFWRAEPGAYVAPFDALGLDPTSTHVTVANPFPVKTSDQTVPLLISVPNAASGRSRPAAGWPVVIFGHGLGGNRTQMLAIADTLASVGYATIAMDAPLHGVVPALAPTLAPFYVGNTPFADDANERTFDVDYIDNLTGAPGPDGVADPSGTHIINLGSMLTSRDNGRQAQADLSVLTVSIPHISIDGDPIPDFDGSDIAYVSLSMGSILGQPFVAAEPMVERAFLSVPMGGIARGLEASQAYGPLIRAGLGSVGVFPGTADYQQFFTLLQTVIDSMDPINWAIESGTFESIVLNEVIGDTVVPNFVATAPLSGTEPLIRAMGLEAYSSSRSDPAGLSLVGRFPPPASHGSLLSPASSPEATAEMQGQVASFVSSKGTTVVVNNAATMVSE